MFHTQLYNLPSLPDHIIQEALDSSYTPKQQPYNYSAIATAMMNTEFYKNLSSVFGKVDCDYLQNKPNSLYDWHTDLNRTCAINWPIKTNPGALTLIRYEYNKPFFWNLEQVQYELYKPTILNTEKFHCVINNHTDDRIILSISIQSKNGYNEVVEYLQNLKIDKY